MTVIIPGTDSQGQRISIQPQKVSPQCQESLSQWRRDWGAVLVGHTKPLEDFARHLSQGVKSRDSGILGREEETVAGGKLTNHAPYFTFEEHESLMNRLQRGSGQGLVLLQNKAPSWSVESGAYVLNFHGRVTQASVKNFQIVHPEDRERLGMGLLGPGGMRTTSPIST